MLKWLFLPLLVAILVTTEAQEDRLWCFRCKNEHSLRNCEKLQKCAEKDSYCVTTVVRRASGEPLLSKGCSPSCAEYPVRVASALPNSTHCCRESFCNRSASLKTGHVVVSVAALAGFFCILQSGL